MKENVRSMPLYLTAAVIAAFSFSTATIAAPAAEPRAAAIWTDIYYPGVMIPHSKSTTFISVGSDAQSLESPLPDAKKAKPAFRVDVLYGLGLDSAKAAEALIKTGQLNARVHLPDSTIIEATDKLSYNPPSTMGGSNSDVALMFRFPWGPNTLEEGWVELRIVDHTYWLEVPYGFTRDPWAPLAPAEPKKGLPAFAPAMKKLPPEDRVVPWTWINYDLGVIQNGWRLGVKVGNQPDTQYKVTLYRESDVLWELDRPKTSVQIVEDSGGTLTAQRIKAYRTNGPFSRDDDYVFPLYVGPQAGRNWGTLRIVVDDNSTEALIPSSLFKRGHGVAEPTHPQRVPVPPPTPVRNDF